MFSFYAFIILFAQLKSNKKEENWKRTKKEKPEENFPLLFFLYFYYKKCKKKMIQISGKIHAKSFKIFTLSFFIVTEQITACK